VTRKQLLSAPRFFDAACSDTAHTTRGSWLEDFA